MQKKLSLIFLFGFISLSLIGQKNRFESFFKELDTMSNNELVFKKLVSFKSSKKLNDVELIAYFKQRVKTAVRIQKYDDALKFSNDGLAFGKKLKNDSLITYFTDRVGVVHYHIGQKDIAINYFEKAIKLAEKCNYIELVAKISSNLGALKIEKEEFKEAEYFLTKALKNFDKIGSKAKETLLTERLLATLYTDTKRYDLAEPLYIKVLKTAESIKDTNLICFIHVYYGKLLELKGEFKQSLEHSEKSLKLAELFGNKNTIELCMVNLSRSYSQNKQFEKSAILNRKAYLLNKSIFQDNLKKSVAETEVKYKTLEIQRQKELAESKILEEKRKNEFYLFVFFGILLLLIILFLIIYLKLQAKRKRIELAIQKHHLEAILEAQEEEKVRIARDLHDGICQKFAATKMRFSAISDELLDNVPDLKTDYKSCITLLDEATNELRSIAHEIMPPALNELGLVEALRLLSHQTFNKNLDFTFEVFGQEERLEQNDEINLYRIAQELFLNVIKHAKASEVAIQLLFSKKQLSLFVEDNGVGFESQHKTGMGLGNINIRCEMLKAKFNVEPGAKGGTFVSIIKAEKI
ncbi:MAG: sensor histidine kinase [Bacteroidota bacterium]